MNELLARRQLKRIMNHGIPRHVAQEIVEYVMLLSTERNICVDFAVNYSVDIIYGLSLTQRAEAK